MKIETKYDIGQKFWYLYEENNTVHIKEDTVTEIVINEGGKILYYGSISADEVPQEQMVIYEDTEKLVKQIKALLESEVAEDEEEMPISKQNLW